MCVGWRVKSMEYSEKFLWLLDMNNLPAKYLTPKKQRERKIKILITGILY